MVTERTTDKDGTTERPNSGRVGCFLRRSNVGVRRTTDLSHSSQGTRPADSWSVVLCLDALSVPSHEHRVVATDFGEGDR